MMKKNLIKNLKKLMIYYNNLFKRLILSRFFYTKKRPERVWIIVELQEDCTRTQIPFSYRHLSPTISNYE